MIIHYSSKFRKQYKNLTKSDNKLSEKINNKIELFFNNSHHTSLRTHKVINTKSGVAYSFWIEGDLRIIFIWMGNDEALFTLIGDHRTVYKRPFKLITTL